MTSSQRRVLVTGASSGIGLSLVKKLALEGDTVFGCARNVQTLQELDCPGKDKVHAIVCDVTKEEQVKSMFQQIDDAAGGLDVCVNNAGICNGATLLEGDPNAWREVYEVNVIGLCIVTQHAVKSMVKGKNDNCIVININSTLGIALPKHTVPMLSFYTGTKHAVTGITSALRGELTSSGLGDRIRVMSVAPGLTETKAQVKIFGEEATKLFYEQSLPLQPDEVADAVLHALKSPKRAVLDQVLWHRNELDNMK